MCRANATIVRRFKRIIAFALMLLSLLTIVASAAPQSCNLCHTSFCSEFPDTVHGQAGVGCSSCHDSGLHGKGMTNQRTEGTCQSCHSELVDCWQSSGHSKAGLGCTECHSIHKPYPGRELAQLKKAEDALCQSCHKLNKELHSGILDPTSIERKSCVICHNPHGGKAGLLAAKAGGEKWELNKAYNHFPVAQGRCQDCHAPHLVSFGKRIEEEDEWGDLDEEDDAPPAIGSKQGLLKKAGSALCYDCHTVQGKHFENTGHARVQNIDLNGEQTPCLGCHLPHASDYPSLTKLPGDQLCVACHSGYTPHHFLSFGSVKQGELDCVECHEPHGVGYRRLLVRENICAMCHNK